MTNQQTTDLHFSELRDLLTVKTLLWLIYLMLLAVLLPHTAWAFKHFEVAGNGWLAWALAFVFEAAVFAFTHNIIDRIERSARLRSKEGEAKIVFAWRRFSSATRAPPGEARGYQRASPAAGQGVSIPRTCPTGSPLGNRHHFVP